MFETPLTVVGHIVNDLQRRKVGDQEVVKFRVASNSRRRTSDGGWEPGNSLFITVNCWGRLVTGVGAALGKGLGFRCRGRRRHHWPQPPAHIGLGVASMLPRRCLGWFAR